MNTGEQVVRANGDEPAVLHALSIRMRSVPYTGDFARAAAAAEEGLALAERTARWDWLARFQVWSGMVAHQSGDDERAVALGTRRASPAHGT